MSYYAYPISRSYDLRYFMEAGDPDIRFEVVKKGSLREQFLYLIQTPAFFCQLMDMKAVRIGRSFLMYQPHGMVYPENAMIEEGLLLLSPRSYGSFQLPSLAEKAAPVVSGGAFAASPIMDAAFYGSPVDIQGEVAGKPFALWRWQ
ncbi:MAG: hypothetical protein HDQ91_01945 [Desulfovibrio sp.]|nr:hypothetical protein [Desulfovibrio sp.]